LVRGSAQQLRLHAEHCRDLAHGQNDERTRVILRTMADEFDQQARDLDDEGELLREETST
jgi:hypothetical protein